jgi:hypothetical protein
VKLIVPESKIEHGKLRVSDSVGGVDV